jgi:transcription elongation factor GreB
MANEQKKPMTRKGYERLKQEMEHTMRVTRPKVVKGIAEAAAEGDRSENAEYIYGKKHLREIDKRLQYLSQILGASRIVHENTLAGDVVCFGSTVILEEETGKRKKWILVGEGESDAKEGTIAWNSPLGLALLGKKVGDLVEVDRPSGTMEVQIIGLVFGERLIAGEDI